MTVSTHNGTATRTPVYFDGCLGWLHTSHEASAVTIGAVVCAPFGQEEICTHHGFMELADRLAAAGIPTVRFDYRGTGNSIAAEVSLRSMVEDTAKAADYLRSQVGACSVVLTGVRLGALVALQAQQSIAAVQALVLMAPIMTGSTYLRENRAAAAVARLASLDPLRPLESWLPLNTNGFHWTGALQREIHETDAATMEPPAVPVFLLPPPLDRRSPKVAEAWRSAGADITEVPFTTYPGWMQDPTTNASPTEAFDAIRDWIVKQMPRAPQREQREVESLPILRGHGFMEAPKRFGKDRALFGILSTPASGSAAPIAALLLHEGSSHTIGNGGSYVTLARHMAREGIASFRMDLSGVGDSAEGENKRHPHYDLERIPESIAALDLLQEHGYPMAVVFGLCSGAYTAFQVSLADRRVVGSIITNIQKFVWTYGADIRVQHKDNKRSLKGYLRATRSVGEWKRALAGKADIRGIARVLTKRSVARVKHTIQSMLPPAPDSEMAIVHAQMKALAQRGVLTNMIFSDDDPGLAEMWMQFGRRAYRLGQFAPARMVIMEEADHHFNASSARERYYGVATSMMQDILSMHDPQTREGAGAGLAGA